MREVFDGAEIVAWAAGTGELCLVLDSLDEVRARVPHVGTLIAERVGRLPCDRLILRILCRTADWPAGLEYSLKQAFGTIDVVEILPLRQSDAEAIAANWCDPADFIREVQRVGAGPLAARPLTLRFLAQAFGEAGSLPERGAALYAAGVRSLCEEQNVNRRDAGLTGALSVDERVAIARRLAAATIFGNATAYLDWRRGRYPRPGPRPRRHRWLGGTNAKPGSGSCHGGRGAGAAGQRCSPAAAGSAWDGRTQRSLTTSPPTGW